MREAPTAARIRCSQALELRITDATNEAKDNVRYLATLDPSFEVRLCKHDPRVCARSVCRPCCTPGYKRHWPALHPERTARSHNPLQDMYSGAAPAPIKEGLRGLLTACCTLHRIARFYGTRDRMTTLLSKVTNQLMRACRWVGDASGLLGRPQPVHFITSARLQSASAPQALPGPFTCCERHPTHAPIAAPRHFILKPGGLWDQPRLQLIANMRVISAGAAAASAQPCLRRGISSGLTCDLNCGPLPAIG